MTEKVFWTNPYQIELSSIVTYIEGNDIELDQTIFYAESGGQESDTGTINGISVLSATKNGTRIVYSLESPPSFAVGETVTTNIDWDRRYALMKLHFAAEVVLEKFYQRYDGVVKVGAHISQEKSRIDFEWPENISGVLKELEIEVQALLDMGLPIISDFSNVEDEKRYWQVDGFARVSCGGTHLKKTSEVGIIKLKRKNLGKGKERVEITLST